MNLKKNTIDKLFRYSCTKCSLLSLSLFLVCVSFAFKNSLLALSHARYASIVIVYDGQSAELAASNPVGIQKNFFLYEYSTSASVDAKTD